MDKIVSEENVRKAIAGVKHPAIDHTLLELGIIKTIKVENGKATIVLALPFPNIPIKDHLINSIREPIEKLGVEVEMEETVMNQEELSASVVEQERCLKGSRKKTG